MSGQGASAVWICCAFLVVPRFPCMHACVRLERHTDETARRPLPVWEEEGLIDSPCTESYFDSLSEGSSSKRPHFYIFAMYHILSAAIREFLVHHESVVQIRTHPLHVCVQSGLAKSEESNRSGRGYVGERTKIVPLLRFKKYKCGLPVPRNLSPYVTQHVCMKATGAKVVH